MSKITQNITRSALAVSFMSIGWYLLSLLVSSLNDVIAKYLGQDIHSMQVTFLRLAFSLLVLLPFIGFYGVRSVVTKRLRIQLLRGVLFWGGIMLWMGGINAVPITVTTTLSFVIPLFTLILAYYFLKEKVSSQRWIATIIGFLGVLIVLEPGQMNFNPLALMMVGSAMVFALLDVINKKYVVKEGYLCMLFYSGLAGTALAAVPAFYVWKPLDGFQFCIFLLLGCGSNLILFFILKAFSLVDASFLAPIRYVELVFSGIFGFWVFNEIPTKATLLGACVIIASTCYVTYAEVKSKKTKVKMKQADQGIDSITEEAPALQKEEEPVSVL